MSTFQGTETSGASVTVYFNQGDEPVLPAALQAWGSKGRGKSITFDSRKAGVSDDEFRLVSVSTTKGIGGGAGRFTFAFKDRKLTSGGSAADLLTDDDWVDITFTRHNKQYHVMRGLIDTIAPAERVGTTGATEETYVVSGRDFTKIFEITPVWFDRITDIDYAGAAVHRILAATESIRGPVNQTVHAMLYGFLATQEAHGRSIWTLPASMPTSISISEQHVKNREDMAALTAKGGVFETQQYAEVLTGKNTSAKFVGSTPDLAFSIAAHFYDQDFVNDPPRSSSINLNLFNPTNQTVWTLGQYYADPALCELYCDLMVLDNNKLRYPLDGEETTPDNTCMAVILRDRPFPTWSRHQLRKLAATKAAPTKAASGADFTDPFDARRAQPDLEPLTLPAGLSATEVDLGLSEQPIDGPYFKAIAQYTIDYTDLTSRSLARSGLERRNAFFAAPALSQEILQLAPDLQVPLMNTADIEKHGMRRLDVSTNYSASTRDMVIGSTPLGMALAYRQRLRDFHAINHLLYAGSLALAHGRPDIRAGGRLIVKETPDALEQDSYYIESVNHTWELTQGIRTTMGVTRGWRGSDQSYLGTLNAVRERYNDDSLEEHYVKAEEQIKGGLPPANPSRRDRGVVSAQAPAVFPIFGPADLFLDKYPVTLTGGPIRPTSGDRYTLGVNGEDLGYNKETKAVASPELRNLMAAACVDAGVPVWWAALEELAWLVYAESKGNVGIPNLLFCYKPPKQPRGTMYEEQHRAQWPLVWADLKDTTIPLEKRGKIYKGTSAPFEVIDRVPGSRAIGIGQLQPYSYNKYAPAGLNSIGDPLGEAVGMLKYIAGRGTHVNPVNVKRLYGTFPYRKRNYDEATDTWTDGGPAVYPY